MIKVGNATILQGHCLERLRSLPGQSVQCCVTSPPYWGLRDYGHADQIGLERTPEEYVAKLIAVFREVRRVLKDDGTLWLNLGDCYATGAGKIGDCPGLKPKDLIGIPWRVAFALQSDGWYLRCDIIWNKPNPMPESVTDRPTKAHEYLFLLSKSERYLYDHEAVKEPGSKNSHGGGREHSDRYHIASGRNDAGVLGVPAADNGRNRRSVWEIAPQPYSGAHFAVFPPKLVEPCILAGSRAGDTVLDPFNGSGTAGIVALKHDRKYIGVELNPEYVALTLPRLKSEQAQMKLAL